MTAATTRETPKFTGVTIHRDPRGRFAIRYPTDWPVFEIRSDEPLTAGVAPAAAAPRPARRNTKARRRHKGQAPERPVAAREGIGFAPDPRDPATVFTVWAS